NYATWKGHLLSIIDRRFVDLVGDQLGNRIRPDELLWGGVGVNGLPPLDHPATVHRAEQRYLADDDVVFGVLLDQEPRAYPERILSWHELVSDRVDGHDLLISYCTPCGSAAAYSATASDGRAYTLGTSGLVYHSRRLLFDEETHSLWDPVGGAAVAGPLSVSGVHLVPLPMLRTTWGEWRARHPDARVLSLDTGYVREYAE